jgi:hypothetical protein
MVENVVTFRLPKPTFRYFCFDFSYSNFLIFLLLHPQIEQKLHKCTKCADVSIKTVREGLQNGENK